MAKVAPKKQTQNKIGYKIYYYGYRGPAILEGNYEGPEEELVLFRRYFKSKSQQERYIRDHDGQYDWSPFIDQVKITKRNEYRLIDY